MVSFAFFLSGIQMAGESCFWNPELAGSFPQGGIEDLCLFTPYRIGDIFFAFLLAFFLL